ncbi:MAG: 50S ribosomal protein L25 [Candidatus Bipolaricaulota bacterium]
MATVKAQPRQLGVKPKELRRRGLVPVVVYGAHLDPVHVCVEEQALQRLFAMVTRSTAVELEVDSGKQYHVFLKDIQLDPVTDRPLHVDMYVPERGRTLQMPVPVRVVGTSPGVKDGGLLEILHEYIDVSARASKMPPYVEVIISSLGLNDSLLVGDLPWGEGVEPLVPEDTAVVTVISPRGLAKAQLEAEEAAEAAEAELEEGLEEAEEEELPEVEPED